MYDYDTVEAFGVGIFSAIVSAVFSYLPLWLFNQLKSRGLSEKHPMGRPNECDLIGITAEPNSHVSSRTVNREDSPERDAPEKGVFGIDDSSRRELVRSNGSGMHSTSAPGMEPTVQYEVFISYCRRNNERLDFEKRPAWVTRFHAQLRQILRQKVTNVQIFFDDSEIRGHEPVNGRVSQAIENATCLIVILSEAYSNSNSCTGELELFSKRSGGRRNFEQDVFIVHYDDIPHDKRPVKLQGRTGYIFFQSNSDLPGTSRPLDDASAESEYLNRMYKLCDDIAAHLKNS